MNFPTADALYWKDAGETTADNEMWKLDAVGIEWTRVTDLKRKKPGLNFWGPNKNVNDISPQDINQGYIGNCWVMAAVSALAERSNRVTRFVLNH